jgi:hypothetical protein
MRIVLGHQHHHAVAGRVHAGPSASAAPLGTLSEFADCGSRPETADDSCEIRSRF